MAHVKTARSRGLTQARLFARHLVKPSMLPAVTMAALIAGELMGGAIITEEVFGRNGIGSVMYQAVSNQDTPVLQGIVALAAVVFVVVNLIADLISPLLDPRVRLGGGGRREACAAPFAAAAAAALFAPLELTICLMSIIESVDVDLPMSGRRGCAGE